MVQHQLSIISVTSLLGLSCARDTLMAYNEKASAPLFFGRIAFGVGSYILGEGWVDVGIEMEVIGMLRAKLDRVVDVSAAGVTSIFNPPPPSS